jgi:hypothetical protein
MSRISLALKGFRELGPAKLGLYAAYQVGLRTGFFRLATRDERRWTRVGSQALVFSPLLKFPGQDELNAILGPQGREHLLRQADEIVSGCVRLFGGQPTPLNLSPDAPLAHWTAYELGRAGLASGEAGAPTDVKFLWEPARFGWAYTLGRAYHLAGDERYAAAFWAYTEAFLAANPPYFGPHWLSAQEVALRLMAWVFSLQVFANSGHTTPERENRLAKAIAAHAGRIPSTLIYARSQNNNHLLTEAAGLYTAGKALSEHPAARGWRQLGWRWFNFGLASQIAPDGAYMQHSANYHRLMLQAALWMEALILSDASPDARQEWPRLSQERLAVSARWLLALTDTRAGQVPNLGPNDGAYILPLTMCPFDDYRPALQAAGEAFLGEKPFPAGLWDEMGLWLGHRGQGVRSEESLPTIPYTLSGASSPHVLHSPDGNSWAYLRVAHFYNRPGHADQLHLDLWWRGLNVAQDAGSYLYNAPPPWDNALRRAQVHNTVTVNGRDQMTRAGRFLYLDWAQGHVVTSERDAEGARIVAQHEGYRDLGLIHQRLVEVKEDGDWIVQDSLLPVSISQPERNPGYLACLHWLLPDWPFELEISDLRFGIKLHSPHGPIELRISLEHGSLAGTPEFQVGRGGKLLHGTREVEPTWGWSSPTYGAKIPALAVRLSVERPLPLAFTSCWSFPKGQT